MSFGALGLGENIVRTLADLGAAAPFAIQAATIPEILAGRDVLARGRTGSGKTIAFGAPLVENVLRAQAGKRREFGRKPKALILAPTRELALQIDRTIQPIARSVGLFTTQIYGGVPQARQVGALKKGVDIIIGTPGRIEDLITQRKLDLSRRHGRRDRRGRPHVRARLPRARAAHPPRDGGRLAEAALLGDARPRGRRRSSTSSSSSPSVHEVAGEDQASSTIEHRVLVIEHRDKARDPRPARRPRRQDPRLRPHPRVRRDARRAVRRRRHPGRLAARRPQPGSGARATSSGSPRAA